MRNVEEKNYLCSVRDDVLIKKDRKTPAGHPLIDVVLMFKVTFLRRYYGLGDHQIQYQIYRPHQLPLVCMN